MCLGILVGARIAFSLSLSSDVTWLYVAVCLVLISLRASNLVIVVCMFSAGALFGLYRGADTRINFSEYDDLFGSSVVLAGTVKDDPSYDIDGDLRLRVTNIEINERSYSGDVWVVTQDKINLRRSDQITVSGVISKGFGTIPAALYRSSILAVIRQDFSDVGLDVRDAFSAKIRTAIQEPEATLATGFLLGQNNQLPEKLDNDLRMLGLTHIIVASGYNLTILVRFARRRFLRISRFTALAVSGLLITGFVQMSGMSPSMTRASLIAGLSLLAWYFGRAFHPIVLLLFAAGVTVAVNPSYIQGDLGWALSFASFAGVILFAPLLQAYFWGTKKLNFMQQVFIETVAAQITAVPIVVFAFGQYSVLSVVANMAVLPLIPLAMLLIFIAGLGGFIMPFAVYFWGFPAELVLRYITGVVGWMASLPTASYEVSITATQLITWYVTLVVAGLYMWRRTQYAFREYNIIE